MSFKINWDAIGVSASLACAVHCAILPLIISSLPLFGVNIINNTSFEIFMIAFAFCVGFFSLYHGWKKHHHQIEPLLIFSIGIIFLFAKQIWYQWEFWFLIPAVFLIVTAHYLNYRSILSAKSILK